MPRFTPEQRIAQVPRLAFRVWEGRGILINPARRESHVLSAVGAEIWSRIKEPARFADVCAQVASDYALPPETAAADCDEFLGALLDKGLVRIVDAA